MSNDMRRGLLNGAAILQPQPGAQIRLPVSAINRMETMRIRAGAEKIEEVLFFALSVYETLQMATQDDRVNIVMPDGSIKPLQMRPPRVAKATTDGVDFVPEVKPAD